MKQDASGGTQNVCFRGEIRKISVLLGEKRASSVAMIGQWHGTHLFLKLFHRLTH